MANRRFIDFPIAASVGDNDIVLIWQDGLNKQTTKATLFAGSPNSLAGLTDVDISALANGQILQYNSTTSKWENVDRTDIDLDQLGDVTIVSPTNGQVLVYNSSTSKWENSSAGFVPYTGAVTTVNLGAQSILAGSFVKAGGTSAQFLKADGSVDSNTYLTTGSAAATYVPYTGATADVNLGTHDLTAERGTFANNGSSDTLTVNHTSGSGYGIIVTKGGNNEALYVSKTSGSGNAMTVIGGRTSLVDLALSSVTNTAGDFLTLSGGLVHKRTAAEVRTDIGAGTVTSVAALTLGTSGTDLSSSVANGTTTPVITLNVPTASATNRGALSSADWTTFNNKQNALTNPVTGTGLAGQVAYWSSSSAITGESNLFWDSTNDRLGIGTATPAWMLQIEKNTNATAAGEYPAVVVNNPNAAGFSAYYFYSGITNKAGLEYSNSSNDLFIYSNGAERIHIFSDGNVFIGSSPSNATFKLDVNGTGRFSSELSINSGATRALRIDTNSGVQGISLSPNSIFGIDEPGVGNARFIINTSGNVGIANNSPSFRLDVSGTGRYFQNSSSLGNATGITLQQSGSGDIAISYQLTGVREWLMGVDNSDSDSFKISNITGSGDFNNTGLCITTGGNVGIGTATPSWMFEVNKNTSSGSFGQYPAISVNNPNASGFSAYYFFSGASNKGGFEYSNSTNNLSIYGNGAERITINVSGNVLIGTGSANSKLQVSGSFATPHTTKSANYTLDATDYTVGFDCASNRTANLPDATTCAGRIYVIYQYNTNLGIRYVTIDPNGSQTISGVATYPLSSYGDFSSVMIQSTGSNWVVISDALYFIPL